MPIDIIKKERKKNMKSWVMTYHKKILPTDVRISLPDSSDVKNRKLNKKKLMFNEIINELLMRRH